MGVDPDTSESRDKSYNKLKLVLLTVIALAIGSCEEFGDPYGLASVADQLSAKVFITMLAPYYGKDTTLDVGEEQYHSHSSQAEIVVVIINDDYASQWPLPPPRYKRLLRNLDRAGADSVLLDIYFEQKTDKKRQQVADLYQFANDLSIPVVFGSVMQDVVPSARHEQHGEVRVNESALIEFELEEGFYKLFQPIAAYDDSNSVTAYKTAALRLYELWCQNHQQRCPESINTDKFPNQDLFLQWGYAPNQLMTSNPALGGAKCNSQAVSMPGRLADSIGLLIENSTRGFNDSSSSECQADCDCPYHTQISIKNLYRLPAEDWKELLADKVVLIGTSLSLHPDLTLSPVQGYVPGVFKHAMALDNLIEFGDHYLKATDDTVGSSTEIAMLALALLIQAILSYQVTEIRNKTTESESEANLLQFYYTLFTLSVICLVVWFVSGFNDWSPGNWIGLATVMFLIGHDPADAMPGRIWQYNIPLLERSRRLSSLTDKVSNRLVERPKLAALNTVAGLMTLLCFYIFIGYLMLVIPQIILLQTDYASRDSLAWAGLFILGSITLIILLIILNKTKFLSLSFFRRK